MRKRAWIGLCIVAAISISTVAHAHFVSPDPVPPKPGDIFNFNRYAYANDNPVRFIDPDGRMGQVPPDQERPPGCSSSIVGCPQSRPLKPEPRKSSATLRKRWEKMTGKKWPKDPATGRNQDVAHKQAVADGGAPNDPQNYEPQPHDQHMREHKDNGDFKRWGLVPVELRAPKLLRQCPSSLRLSSPRLLSLLQWLSP